jgi:Na+/H+ antiporter NhaD/arsenite permease-like protein
MDMNSSLVPIVFGAVYVGMILGGIPGLRMDRTGVALLGAILLLASEALSPEQALLAQDAPTLSLLFGLMVVSAQLSLGGFYGWLTARVSCSSLAPGSLLAAVIGLSGGLSSLLTNDVVCLAIAPLLLNLCSQRGINPVPQLLALACAANVGSAATLIGNPQNILIGEQLSLSFVRYLIVAAPVVLLSLVVVWLVIYGVYRHDFVGCPRVQEEATQPFDRWQTTKGLVVLVLITIGFLSNAWPRDLIALIGAGFLLMSRQFHNRDIVRHVDWPLLVLFVSLFIVNDAFAQSGQMERLVAYGASHGIDLSNPALLFLVTPILSNLVSNVPAVMLLLPLVDTSTSLPGTLLALSSTLAGNLIIVGSIANIIVVETAGHAGLKIDVWTHARVGVPISIITLALTAAWLAIL